MWFFSDHFSITTWRIESNEIQYHQTVVHLPCSLHVAHLPLNQTLFTVLCQTLYCWGQTTQIAYCILHNASAQYCSICKDREFFFKYNVYSELYILYFTFAHPKPHTPFVFTVICQTLYCQGQKNQIAPSHSTMAAWQLEVTPDHISHGLYCTVYTAHNWCIVYSKLYTLYYILLEVNCTLLSLCWI